MYSATSMFCTAAEGVRDSFCTGINELLKAVSAHQCHETDTANYAELPFLATHEKHQFELKGSRSGWVDIIECKGKPLQFVIHLRYPQKRWFSPRVNDWKQLIEEAENQFGPGHCIEMENKTCVHFNDENIKLLLTGYNTSKHQFIEIKMAKGQFCY